MKNKVLILLIILFFGNVCHAGDTPLPVKISLSGRMLIDVGGYFNSPDYLHARAGIPDVRLAGKISYSKNWLAKIDVGFANNNLSLKDVFIEYRYNDNYFRAGNMLGYFSLDQSISSNDLFFNAGANGVEIFYLGRKPGLFYIHSSQQYYVSTGAFLGDGVYSSDKIQPGGSLSLRAVCRPVNVTGRLIHIGGGTIFRVPDKVLDTQKRQANIKGKGVTWLSSPSLVGVEFEHIRNQWLSNVEGYIIHGRWIGQGEAILNRINRFDALQTYTAYGAYLQGGFLIMGNRMGYDLKDALPMMPLDDNSLLLMIRYNHTNLNDNHSKVYGGAQHDVSIGLNYYFNSYFSSRLNYSHIWLDKNALTGRADINMIQLRLQVRF